MVGIEIDTVVLVAALLAAAGVIALVGGISAMKGGREQIVRRLVPSGGAGDGRHARAGPPRLGDALAESLRPLARLATPKGEEASRLRLRLLRAGLRRDHAAQAFLAAKVVLALVFLAGLIWIQAARAQPLETTLPIAVVLAAVGFYGPNLWLSSRIQARQRAISHSLPDALDLLVTCVEAGLGLDAALVRVAGEVRLASPILAEELQLTFLEVKAGLPRVEAFRRLSERTGVDDLKQLSATLSQTELFGTSVGLALRVQASGIRTRRMQRAEEKAAMVGVKMTLPLVFCVLPALFAVIIGPAVVNISEKLLKNVR